MKKIIGLLSVVTMAGLLSAQAQIERNIGRYGFTLRGGPRPDVPTQPPRDLTNKPKPKPAPAPADIRILDGKAYDANLAAGWVLLPDMKTNQVPESELQRAWDARSDFYTTIYVEQVEDDHMVLELRTSRFGHPGSGSSKYAIVKNHPRAESATTGTILQPFRAKPTGRAKAYGSTVMVYDYGTKPKPAPPAGLAASPKN